jgi:hypothetical protein
MKTLCVIVSMLILMFVTKRSYSHLCNDVFAQAKDNLAVKVDVRDGQLRISTNAKFRVYLLNTMDRTIEDIMLSVESKEFTAKVTPAKSWVDFPSLQTALFGGKKQYFDVELSRKPGIPEGKYKIGLKLYNGKDANMIFKSMDMEEAMSSYKIPEVSKEIVVDGKVSSEEWGDSLLCTSLYYYDTAEYDNDNPEVTGFSVMKQPKMQTRIRFIRDNKNIYCMIDCQDLGKSEIVKIMFAKEGSESPNELIVDMKVQKAVFGKKSVKAGFDRSKAEISIPYDLINAKGSASILVNLVRERDEKRMYWKGNLFSWKNPVVYGVMMLK